MNRYLKVYLFIYLSLCIVPVVQAAAPNQWLSKLYTEVLGRAPDQSGWQSYQVNFPGGSCSSTVLKNVAMSFLLSSEFNNLGYNNSEKLLVAFRALYNREIAPFEYYYFLERLEQGTWNWSDVVINLTNSTEFSNRTYSLCTNQLEGWAPTPVMALPTSNTGHFSGGTGLELQALLDEAEAGETVWLEQRAVVRISETLEIPPGVSLATIGMPDHNHYARMARLIRATNFNDGTGGANEGALIRPFSGSSLKSVWIDGQRNNVGFHHYWINLLASGNFAPRGNDNLTVQNVRLSNTAGWSTYQHMGTYENCPCSNAYIADNLITAYASNHIEAWSDGLSIACEDTLVERNDVIDATDVGIVLFRSGDAAQHSIIRNNTIFNGGNSTYGGIAVDPLNSDGPSFSFVGAEIYNNLIWASNSAHMDIILSVGTKAWFGDDSKYGYGIKVTNNTTGSQAIRVKTNIGIAVTNMAIATVQENVLWTDLQQTTSCLPVVNVGVDSCGWCAIQPYTNVTIPGCMGH